MARRTRRQPKVVWLPQDPFFAIDANGLRHSTFSRASLPLVGNGLQGGANPSFIAPVVRDTPINPLTTGSSLADISSSGYRLRRIVGKFWCRFARTNAGSTNFTDVVVSAGFIVLRSNDSTGGGTPINPDVDSYATTAIENTENPWIWRRSWYLNREEATDSTVVTKFGPQAAGNLNLGGNSDGPHIDQKTARIIGPDERLFLVASAQSLGVEAEGIEENIECVWDVRVLASMRTMVGNRRNASR